MFFKRCFQLFCFVICLLLCSCKPFYKLLYEYDHTVWTVNDDSAIYFEITIGEVGYLKSIITVGDRTEQFNVVNEFNALAFYQDDAEDINFVMKYRFVIPGCRIKCITDTNFQLFFPECSNSMTFVLNKR